MAAYTVIVYIRGGKFKQRNKQKFNLQQYFQILSQFFNVSFQSLTLAVSVIVAEARQFYPQLYITY